MDQPPDLQELVLRLMLGGDVQIEIGCLCGKGGVEGNLQQVLSWYVGVALHERHFVCSTR